MVNLPIIIFLLFNIIIWVHHISLFWSPSIASYIPLLARFQIPGLPVLSLCSLLPLLRLFSFKAYTFLVFNFPLHFCFWLSSLYFPLPPLFPLLPLLPSEPLWSSPPFSFLSSSSLSFPFSIFNSLHHAMTQ